MFWVTIAKLRVFRLRPETCATCKWPFETWPWPWPVLSIAFTLIQYLRLTVECFGRVWTCLSRVGGSENQDAQMLNFDLLPGLDMTRDLVCFIFFFKLSVPQIKWSSNAASPVSLRSLVWALPWGRYTSPPPLRSMGFDWDLGQTRGLNRSSNILPQLIDALVFSHLRYRVPVYGKWSVKSSFAKNPTSKKRTSRHVESGQA